MTYLSAHLPDLGVWEVMHHRHVDFVLHALDCSDCKTRGE